MAVAHSEVLLSSFDACDDSDAQLSAELASQLLRGIATALFWGPPALATDPRLQAATAKCLARVPQVGGLSTGQSGCTWPGI